MRGCEWWSSDETAQQQAEALDHYHALLLSGLGFRIIVAVGLIIIIIQFLLVTSLLLSTQNDTPGRFLEKPH